MVVVVSHDNKQSLSRYGKDMNIYGWCRPYHLLMFNKVIQLRNGLYQVT